MNEEEVIEIIEELQCEYKEQENENKYNDYTVFKAKRYSKGLQCLYDLYNKEKEKNKKIKEKIEYYYSNGGSISIVLNDIRELLEERN